MSIGHGPKIITRGLTFAFDMNYNDRWISKSYGGKPTSNYAWNQSSVPQATYTSYSATASGTWNDKHPHAIRAYNEAGTDITGYVNTGVTDWTNTYHAIWEFDPELGKPVVVMRDIGNGAWMAKSWNTGYTYTSMGLTNGDTYTISWLQWVDDIAKSANAGLYGTNTSGTNGFHDGQSNAQSTSYNTKPYTWQRVYATFTVAPSNNTGTTRSCYMYGHYIKRATTKIADVQIEPGVPSTFITGSSLANATRSSTGVLTDWTGNSTITVNGGSYDSEGMLSLTGATSDYLSVSNSALSTQASSGIWTIDIWLNRSSAQATIDSFLQTGSGNNFLWYYRNTTNQIEFENTGRTNLNGMTITNNEWFNFTATGSGGSVSVYKNAQLIGTMSNTTTFTIASTIGIIMGQEMDANNGGFSSAQSWKGKYGSARFYDRVLSATEIEQNFNALRGRYGV